LKDFSDAGISLEVGSTLPTMYGELPIIAADKENITIDLNAPLAGKDLIFDITIKSINL
jgi:FKBP-type peptidyl-prolyl cis-trans isomerase 2